MESTFANNVPTLCLNMIVKNESKIITRLFDSVISIIDCYCICDTGSTDDTVAIAERVAASLQKPIRVFNHTWKNFGHNRTLSFQHARTYVRDTLKWDLAQTYGLLLDGDMVFHAGRLRTHPLTEKG
jgi:glycosyltransferase involved in cell wall biosynthesis